MYIDYDVYILINKLLKKLYKLIYNQVFYNSDRKVRIENYFY